METCELDGCDRGGKLRRIKGAGPRLCGYHYDNLRDDPCEHGGCDRRGKTRRIGGRGPRYCQHHYDTLRTQMIRNGEVIEVSPQGWNTCAYGPCDAPARRRTSDYCDVHYQRAARVGDPGLKFSGHTDDCDCRMCYNRPEGSKWCNPGGHFVPRGDFRDGQHTCRECARYMQYQSRYGLSRQAIESMLEAQDWRCPVDGKDLRTVPWVIDHAHMAPCACGPDRGCVQCVRSILCNSCNTRVGLAEQDKYLSYIIDWQIKQGIFLDQWMAKLSAAVVARPIEVLGQPKLA